MQVCLDARQLNLTSKISCICFGFIRTISVQGKILSNNINKSLKLAGSFQEMQLGFSLFPFDKVLKLLLAFRSKALKLNVGSNALIIRTDILMCNFRSANRE